MKITLTFAVGIAALGLMLLPIAGVAGSSSAPQVTPSPSVEITDEPSPEPTDEPTETVDVTVSEEPPVDEPLPTDEPTDDPSLTCDDTGNFCGSIG